MRQQKQAIFAEGKRGSSVQRNRTIRRKVVTAHPLNFQIVIDMNKSWYAKSVSELQEFKGTQSLHSQLYLERPFPDP
ncbi:Clathrin Light Chain A [Manis pentadactyla]|nr:Clathrin Light Chain A [Manis pentadactyla]